MIKGKVSQTIEDIKSSKSVNTGTIGNTGGKGIENIQLVYPTVIIKGEQHPLSTEGDSDVEKSNSISEDLSERRSSGGSTKQKRQNKLEESDSDFETEILLECDLEQSRLKRGFANLKSKVKSKHVIQPQNLTLSSGLTNPTVHTVKKDTSPSRSTGSSSSSSSLRGTFLRRRRNKAIEVAELVSPSSSGTTSMLAAAVANEMAATVPVVVSGKSDKKSKGKMTPDRKEIEIESGVEMLEDTLLPATSVNNNSFPIVDRKNDDVSYARFYSLESFDENITKDLENSANLPTHIIADEKNSFGQPNDKMKFDIVTLKTQLIQRSKTMPSLSLMGLILVLILPIHDFIRGILTCLLFISVVENIMKFFTGLIDHCFQGFNVRERTNFQIPDYSKMPICEIPAAKEYKTVKSYEGWMNEIDIYDPETYHITMTRSVYVKLEGSILNISNTNARLPKRALWNEAPVDLKAITFTAHRSYDLLGCRIELLPLGLARKRHFNRKYPIQLIVKQTFDYENFESMDYNKSALPRRLKKPKVEKSDLKEASVEKFTEIEVKCDGSGEIDFAETILNADLQKLQDDLNPDEHLRNITIPCGDEVRILLFARAAREKEDWFRRFVAASNGDINDKDLHLPNVKFVDDKDLQAAANKAALLLTNPKHRDSASSTKSTHQESSITLKDAEDTVEVILLLPLNNFFTFMCPAFIFLNFILITLTKPSEKDIEAEADFDMADLCFENPTDNFEGLIMTLCAARNQPDYIHFMSMYQKACTQSRVPVYKGTIIRDPQNKKHHKRSMRHENELWKGIDQSLFLGPSGSVVWANVLAGRLLFSVLQNELLLERIQDFFQKKLNSLKLPSFMEDVIIKNIDLGDKPPLVHRISQPLINERGIWIDADVTYEGLCHVTVTTKLNILRLKRPPRSHSVTVEANSNIPGQLNNPYIASRDDVTALGSRHGLESELILETQSASAIYDSDAESSGSSSTESESPMTGALGENSSNIESSNSGNTRRIFKFVDRIATSNIFQYATEISYVQKAMENMNTNITLGIDVRGLVSRVTINIPPPPSDRVWLAFRAPPRLWLTARPTVGDKSVDWSIVTNVIEGKLCEAVNKYLVYPNMIDLTLPFMGKSASET
uniref:SMP-LTD domain-containing protein n=1 Tax=Glossina brevipalpis TaxID=37001 RepID=A0A1A9WPX7_9MUSC